MVGLIDVLSPPAPGLGFSVLHQKVELDIDLLSRSLKGKTELTISPHSKDLKILRLNCRQCELRNLSVNGRPSSSAPYQDPYKRATLPWNAGVHQYHMLRRKLEGQLKDPPEEELVINLPKSLKIEELDHFSVEALTTTITKTGGGIKRESSDGIVGDLSQGPQTGYDQTARFSSIIVRIEYVIHKIRDGIHFAGWEQGDLRYPHAYSKNSLLPGSACCLFPCVDDCASRSTWDVSIKCPRTIGDALRPHESFKASLQVNGDSLNGSRDGSMEEGLPNFSDEDRALDLAVVCTGDMTDEVSVALGRVEIKLIP